MERSLTERMEAIARSVAEKRNDIDSFNKKRSGAEKALDAAVEEEKKLSEKISPVYKKAV